MIPTPRFPTRAPLALAALALAAATVCATGAARAADDDGDRHEKIRVFWTADDSRDGVALEEVDLAPGESRQIETERGKSATLTRDDDGEGLTLSVDGREIRIAAADELGIRPGERVVVRKLRGPGEGRETVVIGDGERGGPRRIERRIEVGEDGIEKGFVVSSGGVEPDVFVLQGPRGRHGHGFAFGGAPFPGFHGPLLDRIERSEKFQALDPATQEIVREVVRDAAPKWQVRELDGDAQDLDDGDGKVRVWVEREVETESEN